MARGSGDEHGSVSPRRSHDELLSWEQVGQGIEQANREALGLVDDYDPDPLAAGTRELLDTAAEVVFRDLDRDLYQLGNGTRFEDLPTLSAALPACFRSRYSTSLIEQFMREIAPVAEKLKNFPDTYLENTAQELAAHALLDTAEAQIEAEHRMKAIRHDHPLPEWMHDAGVVETEIDFLREQAFEDHDALLLFEPEFDSGQLALDDIDGINLEPQDWFKRFRD